MSFVFTFEPVTPTLLQVDITPLVESITQVSPSNTLAYGWLLAVLLGLIVALGFLIYMLVKRLWKQEDNKSEFIEKSLEISKLQADYSKKVEDRLNAVENKQDTAIAIAQAIIKDRQ